MTALDSPRDWKSYSDRVMVEPDVYAMAGGEVAIFSDRCPGKQTPNEDAAALIPYDDNSGVLVVADGLGAVPVGEQAAALALSALEASIEEAAREGRKLRTAILDGFERANREIQELGLGTATTLAVVEIGDGSMRPYHVGDSMILLVGQRGKIKLQTISHSPVGYALEAGVLEETEAMHHEDRHIVSNVIGTAEMRIELGTKRSLATRDTLLLASDGLFDNLQTDEIVDRLRKGPLEQVAHALVADAQRCMNESAPGRPSKPDDLTFIVYRPIFGSRKAPKQSG